MKLASLVFIILVFLMAFKYTEIFDINILVIISAFFLWFVILYIQTHLKNKERNVPKPVYITQ